MSDIEYPPGCQSIKSSSNNIELIKRLRTLADALHDCPPNREYGEATRFLKLFRHLSNSSFMDNSNSDVQIYLGICLSSILRLYSPEIPATDALQLKEVYFFLFRVLKRIGEMTTENPLFKRYHYFVEVMTLILHPLSEMKDLDDKETIPLYRSLLKSILMIPCGKGWSRSMKKGKVNTLKYSKDDKDSPENDLNADEEEEDDTITLKIMNMLISIATTSIQELDFVPNTILDVLFFYLTEPQKSHYPEAYHIAYEIIQRTKNNIEASIQNVLQSSIMIGHLPNEFEMTGSDNRAKFYDVIRILHHISHDLVATTIPFLSRWLQVETASDRQAAVRLIGTISKDRMCQFGLSEDDLTWKLFLNSSNDESPEVRVEFVKQSKNVLTSNHSHLRGPVTDCLIHLTKDSSETVRECVVETVVEIAKIKLEAVSEKLLKAISERIKDKKSSVRIAAVKNIMALYHHVMTSSPQQNYVMDGSLATLNTQSSSSYTASDKECVKFIPNHIFAIYRAAQKLPTLEEARITIERYFQLYFVPYKVEGKRRMEFMADLFRSLDDVGVVMFSDIVKRSSKLRKAMIGICNDISSTGNAKSSEPGKSGQLKERIRRLTTVFADPQILERILMAFVNQIAEDEKTFEMIKYMISDDYTTKEMESVAGQILSRTVERKTLVNQNHVVTFRRFMDRITPLLMDASSAKMLVELVATTVIGIEHKKKSSKENFARDLALLKIWTENFAHIFTSEDNIEKIRKNFLGSEEYLAVETGLDSLNAIFSISSFRQKLRDENVQKMKWFKMLCADLKEIITNTDPQFRRCCKLATRLTTMLVGPENVTEHYDQIIDDLINAVETDNPGCTNALNVLPEILVSKPGKYANRLLDDLVLSGRIEELIYWKKNSEDDPTDFNASMQLERQPWPRLAIVKVAAIKFTTKVFEKGYLFGDELIRKRLSENVTKVINYFAKIIEKKGELEEESDICEVEKARMRGVSGACLLKLCTITAFRVKVDANLFKNMSYLIVDDAYCVRLYYANRVKKRLSNQLPIDFAACFGLVNLGLGNTECSEAQKSQIDGFKSIILNHAVLAFSERRESVLDKVRLSESQRAMMSAEIVIAYSVWLLANYPSLESTNDVSLLAEIQECLWVVIDALRTAKCNLQQVWKVLDMLKTYGDRPARERIGVGKEELYEQNKKLWAISDLGISMMLYRAKVQMQDDSKMVGINRQFFYVCTDRSDPSEVYAPDILIEDEKQRNGKLPKGVRSFNQLNISKRSLANTSRSTSTLNTARRKGGGRNKTTAKNQKPVKNCNTIFEEETNIEESDSEPSVSRNRSRTRDVFDIPSDGSDESEEVMPVPKKRGKSNGATTPVVSPRKNPASNGSPKKSEKKRADDSLDNIPISPIVGDKSKLSKRKSAKIVASTPMSVRNTKSAKRKNTEESTSPKAKRKSGGTSKEASKKLPIKPRTSRSNGNGSPTKGKKKSDVFEIPEEEQTITTEKVPLRRSTRNR